MPTEPGDKTISVFLADDKLRVRAGVRAQLERQPDRRGGGRDR
jgi:hypothetical protein